MKLMQIAGTVRATSTRCLVSLNVTSVKMDMKSQVDHFILNSRSCSSSFCDCRSVVLVSHYLPKLYIISLLNAEYDNYHWNINLKNSTNK